MSDMTKEDKLFFELETSIKDRDNKNMLKIWDTLEDYYSGDYGGDISDMGSAPFVKTNMLNSAINRNTDMIMPPADFQYYSVPSNKTDEMDLAGSETSEALLNYWLRVQDGMRRMRQSRIDANLLNNAYVRVGFRPDTRPESKKEKPVIDPADAVSDTTGEGKTFGEPFDERVENKNFLIARGFSSIKHAESPGGFVARQFWIHQDEYRKNKNYKYREGDSKLKADVEYTGKFLDPKLDGAKDSDVEGENKYMILWEIFRAPTPSKPDGQYIIWSHTQRRICYTEDALPYEGMTYPVFEFRLDAPRSGYHVVPNAYRALNSLSEHEWNETAIMRQIQQSKKFVITDDEGKDEINSVFQSGEFVGVVGTNTIDAKDVKLIDIHIDTSSAEMGSLRAKSRFEDQLGMSLSSPQLGDKVATEMVLRNKAHIAELNDRIIRLNKFEQEIATAKLTIAKQKMTPEAQVRITRRIDRQWSDTDSVTLEGNYAVAIKTSQIQDMTEGERAQNAMGMFSTLAQIQGMPPYADKINIMPAVRKWVEDMGFPTVGLIQDRPDIDQNFENSMMLVGFPMDVDPSDPHVKHIQEIQLFFSLLDEQNGQIEQEANDAIIEHAQKHEDIINQQSQGAPKMSVVANLNNNAVSAGNAGSDPNGGAALPNAVKGAN